MAHVQPKRGLFDSESEQDPVVTNLSGVYVCSSFYHGSQGVELKCHQQDMRVFQDEADEIGDNEPQTGH